jgi:hypothetical protein
MLNRRDLLGSVAVTAVAASISEGCLRNEICGSFK